MYLYMETERQREIEISGRIVCTTDTTKVNPRNQICLKRSAYLAKNSNNINTLVCAGAVCVCVCLCVKYGLVCLCVCVCLSVWLFTDIVFVTSVFVGSENKLPFVCLFIHSSLSAHLSVCLPVRMSVNYLLLSTQHRHTESQLLNSKVFQLQVFQCSVSLLF